MQPGIDEDSIDSIIVAASEQDSEIMDAKEQPQAKVTRSIVFVTGEAAPYAKSGGLGDVCGSLPIALAARGHRVMVVMPRYLNGTSDKNYAKALYTGKHIKIPCFGGSIWTHINRQVAGFVKLAGASQVLLMDHSIVSRLLEI